MKFLAPLVLVVCLVAAGCGGSGSSGGSDSQFMQASDRLVVTQAEVKLAKDAVNGGNLLSDSNTVAQKLRAASGDGVSTAWIDKEVDEAESTVTNVGCSGCFSVLESART